MELITRSTYPFCQGDLGANRLGLPEMSVVQIFRVEFCNRHHGVNGVAPQAFHINRVASC